MTIYQNRRTNRRIQFTCPTNTWNQSQNILNHFLLCLLVVSFMFASFSNIFGKNISCLGFPLNKWRRNHGAVLVHTVAFAGSSKKSSNQSPIQVLAAIYVAYLQRRANHSTCIAIKVGFQSKVYIPIFVTYLPLFSWLCPEVTNCSHSRPEGSAYLTQPGTPFPACLGPEIMVVSSPITAATKCNVCRVVHEVEQPDTHPGTNRDLRC